MKKINGSVNQKVVRICRRAACIDLGRPPRTGDCEVREVGQAGGVVDDQADGHGCLAGRGPSRLHSAPGVVRAPGLARSPRPGPPQSAAAPASTPRGGLFQTSRPRSSPTCFEAIYLSPVHFTITIGIRKLILGCQSPGGSLVDLLAMSATGRYKVRYKPLRPGGSRTDRSRRRRMAWPPMFYDTEGRRPNREQIAEAAYYRWERRGSEHEGHAEDWAGRRRRPDSRAQLSLYRPAQALRSRADLRGTAGVGAIAQAEALSVLRAGGALSHVPEDASRTASDRRQLRAFRVGRMRRMPRPLRIPFGPAVRGVRARSLLHDRPHIPSGIPVAALKALVRAGISVLPAGELHHFGDTNEWVSNPDHDLDAALLRGLGCACI